MFIAKDKDLIVIAKETREELIEALKFIVYTSIEETDKVYKLFNGKYLEESEIKIEELKAENESLKQKLDELDLKAVRPLRAIISGEATDADRSRLVDLENEAQEIRAKIIENESIINGGANE